MSWPDALDALRQRLAVEELHHHVAVAVGQRAEVEHLEDVIAADAAGRLRLALEALHRLGVVRDGGVQHLDGDAAPDADVLALVDGAHAAFADHFDDAVLTIEDLAGFEGHRRAGSETRRSTDRVHGPLMGREGTLCVSTRDRPSRTLSITRFFW